MPLYEYKCLGCQHVTSRYWRNFSPPEAVACEGCGDAEAERRFSTFAFHKSAETKMAELDPKYDKMVDEAFKNSPSTSDPSTTWTRWPPLTVCRTSTCHLLR